MRIFINMNDHRSKIFLFDFLLPFLFDCLFDFLLCSFRNKNLDVFLNEVAAQSINFHILFKISFLLIFLVVQNYRTVLNVSQIKMVEVKVVQGDDEIILCFVFLRDLLHHGHYLLTALAALVIHEDKHIFVLILISSLESLVHKSCQSFNSWLRWDWLRPFENLSCAGLMSG